jgi:hypothetical protein
MQEISMPEPLRPTRIDETDAKAGSKEGVVRWVLAISIGLTVLAFAVIVLTGALSQGPVESQQNAERKVEAQREQRGDNDSSIDGVVADDPDAGAPKTSGDR